MTVLKDRPEKACPRIIVADAKVLLWVGHTGPTHVLKEGERISFNKHGTFVVKKLRLQDAFLEVKIPRKGWNPTTKLFEKVHIPPESEVSIYHGEIYISPIDSGTWQEMKDPYQPWRHRHNLMREQMIASYRRLREQNPHLRKEPLTGGGRTIEEFVDLTDKVAENYKPSAYLNAGTDYKIED